jgi:hypothetical protein
MKRQMMMRGLPMIAVTKIERLRLRLKETLIVLVK